MDVTETMSVRMASNDGPFARPKPKPTPGEQVRTLATRFREAVRLGLSGRRKMVAAAAAVMAVALLATSAIARVPRSSGAKSDDPALPATPAATLPLEFGLPSVLSLDPSGSAAVSIAVSAAASTGAGIPPPPGPASVVAPSSGAGPTTPTVVVHAAGAVTAPGVYRLPDPARVTDVVAAAGGLTSEADPDVLNLAARVGDGERIFVPRRGQAAPGVVVGTTGSGSGASASNPAQAGAASVVDLNTASVEQLDLLPGIGPAIAARIIEQRARTGRFRSVNQLLDVPGIGEAKFASLKSRVKV